jgi:L,D-transpeptidase YcbB
MQPARVALLLLLLLIPTGGWAGTAPLNFPQIVTTFHTARGAAPLWLNTESHQTSRLGKRLITWLRGVAVEGLHPNDYHLVAVDRALAAGDMPATSLEHLLSDAFVTYADHLSRGRLNPHHLGINWHLPRPTPDLAALLATATRSPRHLRQALEYLREQKPGYLALMQSLAQYRQWAAEDPWPTVPGPARKKIEAGTRSSRVIALRARLAATGELRTRQSPVDGVLYDDRLVAAVKNFQRAQGLTADGVVGRSTLKALNVTAAHRVRNILVNLERLRWLPVHFGDRYVVVNIPAYDLALIDRGSPAISMRTIVGTVQDKTPVMTATMQYLVFNPEWNVPESITTKELIPKILDDPTYLAQRNYQVFQRTADGLQRTEIAAIDWTTVDPATIRIRQSSGRGNALGSIKFIFPNRHSVYLHDTPSRDLFERQTRAFSHGCVRIEHPRDLATVLLAKQDAWTKEEVYATAKRGKKRVVQLEAQVPVYFLYHTAWAEKHGPTHFRRDIYNYDRVIARRLCTNSTCE